MRCSLPAWISLGSRMLNEITLAADIYIIKEENSMESTLKDLKERRSIRAYKAEQIKEEELQKILEAGTYAPTGMGMQSPKIVVVQDKETRDYLSELFI